MHYVKQPYNRQLQSTESNYFVLHMYPQLHTKELKYKQIKHFYTLDSTAHAVHLHGIRITIRVKILSQAFPPNSMKRFHTPKSWSCFQTRHRCNYWGFHTQTSTFSKGGMFNMQSIKAKFCFWQIIYWPLSISRINTNTCKALVHSMNASFLILKTLRKSKKACNARQDRADPYAVLCRVR